MDDENGDEEEVEDGMREESRKQPLVFVICLVQIVMFIQGLGDLKYRYIKYR